MGFAEKWTTNRVMRCVRSVSYVVKLNDHISSVIRLGRGLKQGDPLSPYLFLLCTELLSSNIAASVNVEEISGVKINRTAPAIYHLFFADDSIFFVKANANEVSKMKEILIHYEEIRNLLWCFGSSKRECTIKYGISCQKHHSGRLDLRTFDGVLGIEE
ncbi:unnamed protein product [Rhodiola kirilowii]